MRLPRGFGALLLFAWGCAAEPAEPVRHEPLPPPPGPIADAGGWASRMGAAADPPPVRRAAEPIAQRAAVMRDDAEGTDQTVLAGRLVYRVSFRVPPIFRDHRAVIEAPAGELHVDVSLGRLRARFVGPGWPIDEGSEVRLRGDLFGAYLFDGQGGRSLGAGQMAAWFEGRERGESQTMVGVRREYSSRAKSITENEEPVPGELLCALLAEWSNQERSALIHRCSAAGSLPPGFRIGPWSGELTAVVPMELPRRTLRADEGEPPAKVPARGARVLLEAEALERLTPSRPGPEPGRARLRVENRTDTRAIVIVQGVALGWVDAGQSLQVDGLTPGFYRIGAIRPLGVLRTPPRLFRVPGDLVLGLHAEAAAGDSL
jgi:hypothetical protein